MAERESDQQYTCRCVIVLINDSRERCGARVSVDQPFCGACEGRHEDLPSFRMEEIKEITADPIGVPA